MPNLSVITLAGHLGRDAELKTAGNTPVCKFSIAVTTKRRAGDSTAWYACELFGARAEKLAPMLTKGKALIVSGELVPREYKGKNDELRTSLDVNVNTLTFAGGGAGADREEAKPRSAPAPVPADDADSEIPF